MDPNCYAVLKRLNIPKIANTCPGMYLVRISRDGDQTKKLDTVIKKIKEEITEKSDPEAVHIVVATDILYFDNEFVNYEHKYCEDEKVRAGVTMMRQEPAVLSLWNKV